MNVHITIPFRTDKNLGAAYNTALSLIPDDDWICFLDHDVLLLTPDAGNIIHEYARLNPEAGIITALTNRISPKNTHQLLTGKVEECSDIKSHVALAEDRRRYLYQTKEVHQDISGMFMMISKATWNEFKFNETGLCLGVDTEYNRRIRAAGRSVLVALGLYVWHSYRISTNIKNKNHLR